MMLDYPDIINKHQGKPAIVLGHGPSLNPYLTRQEELRDRGFVRIGCNEWDSFYDLPPDYWINANSVSRMETQLGRIQSYAGKTTVCWAYSIDKTDPDWFDRNFIGGDHLPYDQRHADGQPCGFCPNGCRVRVGRKMLQQELQAYTGASWYYSGGDTVALHMISFGILMGCNPIYVAGTEFNYHLGYAQTKDSAPLVDIQTFDDCRDRILEHLFIIRSSAEKIGVDVLNLNPNPPYEVLKVGTI